MACEDAAPEERFVVYPGEAEHRVAANITALPLASLSARAGTISWGSAQGEEISWRGDSMCRNIKPLFNYEPAATAGDVHASALQYVRKVSGFTHPSRANQAAFDEAVARVAEATTLLLAQLTTTAPTRDREREVARARARRKEAEADRGSR